jgi:hypothetical protein
MEKVQRVLTAWGDLPGRLVLLKGIETASLVIQLPKSLQTSHWGGHPGAVLPSSSSMEEGVLWLGQLALWVARCSTCQSL